LEVARNLKKKKPKPNKPDSRLRGNDEPIHTETCTASFPRTYIPSFPRKWESRISKASANL
ncbi:TPA: hypothetical protein ACLAOE_002164, partial [Neisseria meningitidis]